MPTVVRNDLPKGIPVGRPVVPLVLRTERAGINAPLATLKIRGDTNPRILIGAGASDRPQVAVRLGADVNLRAQLTLDSSDRGALLLGSGSATPDIRFARSSSTEGLFDRNGASGLIGLAVRSAGGNNAGLKLGDIGDGADSVQIYGGGGISEIRFSRPDAGAPDSLWVHAADGPTTRGGGIVWGTGLAGSVPNVRAHSPASKVLSFDDDFFGPVTVKVVGDLRVSSGVRAGHVEAKGYTQDGIPLVDAGQLKSLIFDAVAPAQLTSKTAAAGSALTASHRDHAHSAQVSLTDAAGSDYGLRVKQSGDTQYRLIAGLDSGGLPQISFGPGGVTNPTHLLRESASTMFVEALAGSGVGTTLVVSADAGDAMVDLLAAAAGYPMLRGSRSGESFARWRIAGGGEPSSLSLGGGAAERDVWMRRDNAKVLTLDDGAAGAASMELRAGVAPATPGANLGRLWFNSANKHFYQRDDAGVDTDLAAAGVGSSTEDNIYLRSVMN